MSHSPPRPDFADVSQVRRRNMAAIKGRHTRTELALRRLLHGMGYRYRLHVRGLPGRPDLVFPARRKAIFIHGCFWHRHAGCPNAVLPKARADWWAAKLAGNTARDARHIAALAASGWRTLVVWECELRRDAGAAAANAAAFLGPPGQVTLWERNVNPPVISGPSNRTDPATLTPGSRGERS